ncbi:hypothetical protein AB0J86_15175 [Micromonospora sp. NPDC049559]|uniref:hypothetical protein n=1 Tax=Micromonospora sp. NPDC049559 TaxID=3155923 RepID=UPI0034287C33
MTHPDESQDRLIRLLAPKTRLPDSVLRPTAAAGEEMLQMIMRESVPDTRPVEPRHRRLSWLSGRRLLLAVPAAAALAALVLVVTVMLPSSGPGGPAPAQARALDIAQEHGYVVVRILDPVADPARYRAELAEHGLDVELVLAPADPEHVGRVLAQDLDDPGTGPRIQVIEAPGNCTANGDCSVGIKVPVDYRAHARIVIGRTPVAGESVAGDAPVLGADEEQQLRALVGKRVSEVRRILSSRGQTAQYRVGADSRSAEAAEVPGDWYVYDTAPLAGGVVVLWVSETGTEPTVTAPGFDGTAAPGTPPGS